MPDRVPAGHHALLGGAVVFFGTHPKTKRRFVVQSIEGGGWGGRPFEDGESGTVSVCQGDVRNGSIEGIELKCPVVVQSRELRTDSLRRRKVPGKFRGGLGIDMQVKNLVEGKWNFEMPRRGKCPPWGIRGGTPGRARRLSAEAARRAQVHDDGRQPHPGRRSAPRPSSAPAAAAAGASRWIASPAWSRTMSRRASSRPRPRASSTAWWSEATCRLTKARPGSCESSAKKSRRSRRSHWQRKKRRVRDRSHSGTPRSGGPRCQRAHCIVHLALDSGFAPQRARRRTWTRVCARPE